ncbi:hypothetical protein HDU96_007147 [Phlyctochytrium bullatum]|nr:hypothetical protein HDU96_007147 [Phlyctochytrium bullatum]
MVVDKVYQHLISWNYSGTSFIVCNVLEFSREVLPKHFKHNNFSSFVRQLNMYGFHKVNKSPRGSRTLAENQVWEFSHPKFLRDRPDLLDEIKRKPMESEALRRETGDIQVQIQTMQLQQAEMAQQISTLHETLSQVLRQLNESQRKQQIQQMMMKNMMEFMKQHHQQQYLPPELTFEYYDQRQNTQPQQAPAIFALPPADGSGSSTFMLATGSNDASMIQNHMPGVTSSFNASSLGAVTADTGELQLGDYKASNVTPDALFSLGMGGGVPGTAGALNFSAASTNSLSAMGANGKDNLVDSLAMDLMQHGLESKALAGQVKVEQRNQTDDYDLFRVT